jgi:hypothetical protein
MSGEDVDVHAITRGADVESGVPNEDVLIAFTEAAVGRDGNLPEVRDELVARLGADALVDTAAVIGNFERMVRIADGTGIPLDTAVSLISADLQESLGVRGFGQAALTPEVRGMKRVAARMLRPLVPQLMRLADRFSR